VSVRAPDKPDYQDGWKLREWIIFNPDQKASFKRVPVANTPFYQFYLDVVSASPLGESERAEFQKQFMTASLNELLQPEFFLKKGQRGYKPDLDPQNGAMFNEERNKIEVLNRIGVQFALRFEQFKYDSEGQTDNPERLAGDKFRANLTAKLSEIDIGPIAKPDETAVLSRLGAVTCGGCHHFTMDHKVGQVKGQDILWPESADVAGHVHVTEDGKLSSALLDVFLPWRKDRLAEAVCLPSSPNGGASTPGAQTQLNNLRQARWQELLDAAGAEKDEGKQRVLTLEAFREIMIQREKERQKPGYFVTYQSAH
jgi:hypothetical protein